MNLVKRLTIIIISCTLTLTSLSAKGIHDILFTRMDSTLGLGDNRVYHILQTRNGNIAVTTHNNICIYNGLSFTNISTDTAFSVRLDNYTGAYHTYTDRHDRLWIKDTHRVKCLQLSETRFRDDIKDIIRSITSQRVIDLFVSDTGNIWCVTDKRHIVSEDGLSIAIPARTGDIQDIMEDKNHIYLFSNLTDICKIRKKDGQVIYTIKAFDDNRYSNTSLVLRGQNGNFYQLRNDMLGGACLCFNTSINTWETLFETDYVLHTITADEEQALVTSRDVLWQIELDDNHVSKVDSINLNGTWILPTHMNTIFADRQNGIWMGSYHNGLLYGHPSNKILRTSHPVNLEEYDNADGKNITGKPYPLMPELTDILVNGAPQTGQADGKTNIAYTRQLTIKENDKIQLTYTPQNFPQQKNLEYRIRVGGDRHEWRKTEDYDGHIDNNGCLTVSLDFRKQGTYEVSVAAFIKGNTTQEPANISDINVSSITVDVQKPWWSYMTLHIIISLLAVHVVTLILSGMYLNDETDGNDETGTDDSEDKRHMTEADKDFLNKATRLVEQNMSSNGYGVEQLANDLCMERTGLYKKLNQLADTTPSAFIKRIKINNAIKLLEEGNHSVNEVAETCGLGSSSYMSRCFQSEFGCTPLEYVKKHRFQQ